MHYLVLGCDVAGDTPLRPQFEDAPALPVLQADLTEALLAWNEEMAAQIALRPEVQAEIDRLNREGVELAERVSSSVSGGAKVHFLRE